MSGALLCLDVTEAVVDEAVQKGCNLIVSHHPLIFRKLSRISDENYVQRTVRKAIKNDVTIVSMHTNMDAAAGGVNFKIAEKLGLELQIDDMDFDAALLSVQQGKADIAMAGITVTDERMAVMSFSDSYATGIQSIIVPNDSDIASPDDLAGKTIGTQRGTTGYIYCSDDFGDENVVAYDDGLTAVQALNNGQVDAVVIDNAPAQEFVAANPGLKVLDTSYAEEDYAIGMAKGSALEDAVNKALEELKADGTLQAIVDKYINAN